MKKEILGFLMGRPSPKRRYADLTMGACGHTRAILDADPDAEIISFDQDPDAIKNAQSDVLPLYPNRFQIVHDNFSQAPAYFKNLASEKEREQLLDGILMDLGVSSHQLDCAERGLSFQSEGPLDMRMDFQNNPVTAADLVNDLNEEELVKIFSEYGEERWSVRIAKAIVAERKLKPFKLTSELENTIFHCYPAATRKGRIHPATRVFQALRIAVNNELGVLSDTIPQLFPFLKPGGRLAIMSFHSLEDRIVKNAFRQKVSQDESFHLLTKKPLIASPDEAKTNPRSRSAKLRVIEKL